MFEFRHSRRILNRAGAHECFELTDYALAQYRDPARTDGRLPEAFVAARDLAPAAHLAMQAALQPFVDSAISKTVNVPEDCPLDVFRNIYRHAWELGLKGCTTYRPGTVRGEILATDIGEGGIADAHCCSIEREAD